MTFLGKLFVVVNAVVAAALATWASAAYVNRVPWATVEAEPGKTLDAKVKELVAAVKVAQTSYGPAQTATAQAEADLEYRRKRIAERRAEALNGKFFDLYFDAADKGKYPVADPRDNAADPLSYNYRQLWGPLPADKAVLGVDRKTPVRGLDVLQKELDTQISEAVETSDKLQRGLAELQTLTKAITGFDIRIERQGRIRDGLGDERDFLADQRVNFEETLVTVTKRSEQLKKAIARYEPK